MSGDDNTDDFKENISKRNNIPSGDFTLIFNEETIDQRKSVNEYRIGDKSVLQILPSVTIYENKIGVHH